jgi:hypothetical protein
MYQNSTKNSMDTIPYVSGIGILLLSKDTKRRWHQMDNKNCFASNELELVYCYETYIKYFEDMRVNNFEIINYPISDNDFIEKLALIF